MRILPAKELNLFLRRRRLALKRAEDVARPILDAVRRRGDRAVAEFAKRFDGYDGPLRLNAGEMYRAWKATPSALRHALRSAALNITKFASLQELPAWIRTLSPGVRAGQVLRPLSSAGCYVPGGRFPLPSTVLMTAIPARVANVRHIAVACPGAPEIVLAAAHLARADAVHPIGGVQAVAAFAYGTKKIARVDKIVGPGNLYVTAAKRLVSDEVGIDFIAGPTEVVLVAGSGNPEWLAADLVAQAEHDPAAVAILLTPSRTLAEAVAGLVPAQWKNCAAVLTQSIDEALDLSNRIAPEHLWLAEPTWLGKVENAGSIFLGPYSPVAAGDYATGPNHTLPTSGGARLRGGLSVHDFVRIVTVQQLSRPGLARLRDTVTTLARAEGLEHHARSVEVRFT